MLRTVLPLPLTDIEQVVRSWSPPTRPHCSDCSQARVYGRPDDPLIYCMAGFDGDKKVKLWRLIRPVRAVGFRNAERCPSFDSMGDRL